MFVIFGLEEKGEKGGGGGVGRERRLRVCYPIGQLTVSLNESSECNIRQ